MTNAPKIDSAESAVKLTLDHAELIERVPELQRGTTAVNFNDSGGLVLVLPRHPAVMAFIQELDGVEYEAADLKTARRRLRVATHNYQTRVALRVTQNLDGPKFSRFVSLSAILIVRAAAKHWRKTVNELEYTARIKEQNRQSITRHRLRSMGLAC